MDYTANSIPQMGFFSAVTRFFTHYADFSGRSRRREFWFVYLFANLVMLLFSVLMFVSIFSGSMVMFVVIMILVGIYSVATIVPNLALTVRRLHDIGKSGWYYFMGLIPFAGPVILLVYSFTDSQGPNQYGPSPKYNR